MTTNLFSEEEKKTIRSMGLYWKEVIGRSKPVHAHDILIEELREVIRVFGPKRVLLSVLATADVIPDLISQLDRLARAAAHREGTMGDPMRLIECQAELRDATDAARETLSKVKEE